MTADEAREALRTLDDGSPRTLRLVGSALRLAGGPLAMFGQAVEYKADALERGDAKTPLANLALRHAARRTALFHPELVERLEYAEEPFWAAIHAATSDPTG